MKGDICADCAFAKEPCYRKSLNKAIGSCRYREDVTSVVFKKLEKVGEPIEFIRGWCFQKYQLADSTAFYEGETRLIFTAPTKTFVYIEINQNKEDMEEQHSTENYPTKEEKIAERIANKVGEDIQNQLEKNMNKLKLKPFSLEAAKAGKPVCTRDGRKARIICFDRKNHSPIIALVETFVKEYNSIREDAYYYTIDGRAINIENESKDDLMMLPEKKEGWVNLYREESNNNERLIEQTIYKTRKDAFDNACPKGYVKTVKITWEE